MKNSSLGFTDSDFLKRLIIRSRRWITRRNQTRLLCLQTLLHHVGFLLHELHTHITDTCDRTKFHKALKSLLGKPNNEFGNSWQTVVNSCFGLQVDVQLPVLDKNHRYSNTLSPLPLDVMDGSLKSLFFCVLPAGWGGDRHQHAEGHSRNLLRHPF